MNLYNDIAPDAALWLRGLMRDNLIPEGTVDERSIADIQPRDLDGFDQCHFFAGIGGWPLALELAGWPATVPVWTGSCPCQPFSCAGARKGTDDDRHLWPAFYRLIRECRPAIVFGEQVASADVIGTVGGAGCGSATPVWFDGISADLEAADYTVGACVLGAHSVGAPHQRQRLYWCAINMGDAELHGCNDVHKFGEKETERRMLQYKRPGGAGGVEIAYGSRQSSERHRKSDTKYSTNIACASGGACGIPDADRSGCETQRSCEERTGQCNEVGVSGRLCDTDHPGPQGRVERDGMVNAGRCGRRSQSDDCESPAGIDRSSPWGDYDIIPFRDGKCRRAESGTLALAASVPRSVAPLVPRLLELGFDAAGARRLAANARHYRVGALRGYGNAIVPPVAAAFIKAVMDVLGDPNETEI